MRAPRFLSLLLAVFFGGSSLFAAGFRLAAPISDHMVLQREKPVAVWGWADAGESVTVTFAGQSKSASAGADGKWMLKLDALPASAEPRTLVVTGKDGHQIEVKAPEGIKLAAPTPTSIVVDGANKEVVGQIAAEIRSLRPPEPYKGKGVKYQGENIRRKAGKAGGK